MSKRFQSAACAGIEIRSVEGDTAAGKTLIGYAAKFGVRSLPLGGFVEEIAPGAFDDVLTNDVVALFNHDPNQILGRSSAGSLSLSSDATGLRYEVLLGDDEISTRVAKYIADKRVAGSSFGFTVAAQGDRWDEQDDGVIVRTILRVGRLYDVSPVTYPAYPDASVQLRAHYDADRAQRDAASKAVRDRYASARRREMDMLHR